MIMSLRRDVSHCDYVIAKRCLALWLCHCEEMSRIVIMSLRRDVSHCDNVIAKRCLALWLCHCEEMSRIVIMSLRRDVSHCDYVIAKRCLALWLCHCQEGPGFFAFFSLWKVYCLSWFVCFYCMVPLVGYVLCCGSSGLFILCIISSFIFILQSVGGMNEYFQGRQLCHNCLRPCWKERIKQCRTWSDATLFGADLRRQYLPKPVWLNT